MKTLILLVTLAATQLTFASTAQKVAVCSSSGFTSLYTYEISFVREMFSIVPTRGDAYFVITKYPENVSVKLDLLDTVFDIDTDGTHILKSESKDSFVEILFDGRASGLKIELDDVDSPLNINAQAGILCSIFK
jgi:hypothetical protein